MPVKFKNNAVSVLSAGVSGGATSIPVTNGNIFPSLGSGEFTYIRLGTDITNEVVKVTARSGDVLTCEAITGSYTSGSDVIGTVTSEAFEEMLQKEGAGVVAADLELKDYSETLTSPSSSSGTLVLDIGNGNVFEVTLTENVSTLTISNPPASGKAGSFTLILKQDATGGWTFAWPVSVKWSGGTAPTLTTTANAIDLLAFATTDGGTTWYGMAAGENFS